MLVYEGYGQWAKPLPWTLPVYMQKKNLYAVPKGFYSSKSRPILPMQRPIRTRYIQTFHFKPLTPKPQTPKPPSAPQASTLYVNLSSWGYKYSEKKFNLPIVKMELISKYSKSPCIYGKTYGFRGNVAWVNRGCRGRFRLIFRGRFPKEIREVRTVIQAQYRKPGIDLNKLKADAEKHKSNILQAIEKFEKAPSILYINQIKSETEKLCNIIGKIASGGEKNSIYKEYYDKCKSQYNSVIENLTKAYKMYEQRIKATPKPLVKHKVISRQQQPRFRMPTPSIFAKGITFTLTKPVIEGTTIAELPKGAEILPEEKPTTIKSIMEKRYFGIPFKYLALGGIGLIALLSILNRPQQPQIIPYYIPPVR